MSISINTSFDGIDSGRTCPRIALYSHDTQGLGHIRRNLLLASVFRRMGCEPVVLMLSGAREVGSFAMPPGVDCVTIPALSKNDLGQYGSRCLNVSVDEVVGIRRGVFQAALESFRPDVFIVDKAPRGALNELDGVLSSLRSNGRTRVVLGLREVLDDAESVAKEWQLHGFDQVVQQQYDRVWIYGDRRVFDTASEYAFSDSVQRKVRYTGYLDPRDTWIEPTAQETGVATTACLPDGPFVLCAVGGGQDGAPLARAFLSSEFPKGWAGVLVTGPQMPAGERAEFRTIAAARGDVRVLEFVTDCRPVLERASRVICMGGYNTVCEVLSYEKPALIVPRIKPRTEQLIRAERMARLGLVDVASPTTLTPRTITTWLRSGGPAHAASARTRIDLNGTARLPGLLHEVLREPSEVSLVCN